MDKIIEAIENYQQHLADKHTEAETPQERNYFKTLSNLLSSYQTRLKWEQSSSNCKNCSYDRICNAHDIEWHRLNNQGTKQSER